MAIIRNRKGGTRPILSALETSAMTHVADAYPMPSVALGRPGVSDRLYQGFEDIDVVDPELYAKFDVKRGLRNADGSGVLVGLTTISNVHGYNKTPEGVVPDEGDLIYRGYHIADLIDHAQSEDRFGYEEAAYLLMSGTLPTEAQLDDFKARIDSRRQLPEGFLHIFPRTTYSQNIMNVLQRATLLLYSFDPTPDDTTPTHEIDVALSLLGRWPRTAAVAHEAAVAAATGTKLLVPPAREGFSMAETLLDVLHAEHGGGNNSTFTTRVLSSSGTDAYSAYAAAIGSLKGPKHGGANAKVGAMIEDASENIEDWTDEDQVAAYLTDVVNGNAFDGSGLIYGLGHAVYTLSDPRAVIIKKYARKLAHQKGRDEKLALLENIEKMGPQIMRDVRGVTKPICANIDLYTGFVYSMLGIPADMYTAIFAMARLAGWCAHRMEELYGAGRIIRPAYNSVMGGGDYVPMSERR
ncbi:citrate/2-methylcitrate synthase [Paratractidigestivibacter sp.]|uniref:citrate/2-methylcitrate synthase n=1 Tax=Paratractidigestivibacter sp. TaxID=2847316 RepID=UPI0040280FCE